MVYKVVLNPYMGYNLYMAKISVEEYEKRINICKTCEHFDSYKDKCKLCGCYMTMKTRLSGESCPVGKW